MNELPVLISETSSGFGRAGAIFLSKNGLRVFAGIRNKSVGNISQKYAFGKFGPLSLDVLEPIRGKGLPSFIGIMIKSGNEATHLISDLNSQTAEYSLNSKGIPSEKVTDPVHQKLISKRTINGYLLDEDAIFFKSINCLPDIVRDRIMLMIMKI